MIKFNFETEFDFTSENVIADWIEAVIAAEGCKTGEINYIFCDDAYLHKLNLEFLKHDTLTDIISFDYSVGKELHGDVFISIERVKENAIDFDATFDDELHRVLVHGILHYCGYSDKNKKDTKIIREKENFYLDQLSLNS